MSENIISVIAVILIATGVIFEIISVSGLFRLKFVLNRMHAGAIGDTLALLCVMIGLIILSGFTFTSLKLALIVILFWIVSPVQSHLLANLIVSVDEEEVVLNADTRNDYCKDITDK